jgi:hypothetical protein
LKLFEGDDARKSLIEKYGEKYVARCQEHKARFDKEELQKKTNDLIKLHLENVVYVRVPFFGFVFDVNDLGMLAGFSFISILLMCRYSLSRELENLKLFFAEAHQHGDNKKTAYHVLAMTQVFTIPPIEGTGREKIWSFAPQLIYFLPLMIQVLSFINDVNTINVGFEINPRTTLIVFVSSFAFLVLILILTVWCSILSRKIDSTWEKQAQSLGIN